MVLGLFARHFWIDSAFYTTKRVRCCSISYCITDFRLLIGFLYIGAWIQALMPASVHSVVAKSNQLWRVNCFVLQLPQTYFDNYFS